MEKQLTLSARLRGWAEQLQAHSDSPRLEAEVLFKHVSGFSDTQLILEDSRPIADNIVEQVQALVDSRTRGTPIAYLTGLREFYGLDFRINQHVLIPRPETELLVDTALELVASHSTPDILDLGTGSGAIAIAIARQLPQARVIACDQSLSALRLASQNAGDLKVRNCQFIHSDWYARLNGQHFDLILSNPPYIDPLDPHLSQGDVRFEPRRALVSEDHGLADLRAIICNASNHLKPGGKIAMEHGFDQGRPVRDLLRAAGFAHAKTLRDLSGHERVSLADSP